MHHATAIFDQWSQSDNLALLQGWLYKRTSDGRKYLRLRFRVVDSTSVHISHSSFTPLVKNSFISTAFYSKNFHDTIMSISHIFNPSHFNALKRWNVVYVLLIVTWSSHTYSILIFILLMMPHADINDDALVLFKQRTNKQTKWMIFYFQLAQMLYLHT